MKLEYDCICYKIKKETIMKAVEDNNIKNIRDLHPHCHAGYACGRCLPYIESFIVNRNKTP